MPRLSLALIPVALLFATSVYAIPAGTIETRQIHSPSLEGNLLGDPATRDMRIYLPASYQSSQLTYPTLYVLHGFGANIDESYFSREVHYDSLMASGQMSESIVVMVDGSCRFFGCNYLNSVVAGDFETYITQEIVGFVDANYRTIPHRDSRGIWGHSMGATGALHLALLYPEVFSAVTASAGFYDFSLPGFRSDWMEGIPAALAADWDTYGGLGIFQQDFLVWSAATIPDPDNPPFFIDVPYVEVDGVIQEPSPGAWDAVWDQVSMKDAMHDLQRYMEGDVRLRFIGFFAGPEDPFFRIDQPRAFDARLTELGIEHTYIEDDLGHFHRIDQALPLLSQNVATLPPGAPTVLSVSPKRVAAVAGEPRQFDLHVRLSQPLGSGERLVLDSTELGVAPLSVTALGGGEYAARTTITPPHSGRFHARLVLETEGQTFTAHRVPVDIFAREAARIVEDGLSEDWSVSVSGGALEPDFAATIDGESAAALAVQPESFVGWTISLTPTRAVDPFSYSALSFAFHPGDAAGRSLVLSTGSSRPVALLGPRAGDLAVDLERAEWQRITVPLDQLLDPWRSMNFLQLSGNLEGTFYIDDLRLVASPPPEATTAVTEQHTSAVPEALELSANYPNPFNSQTVIRFRLPHPSQTKLSVFSLTGQRVATLVSGHRPAGDYSIHWEGRDDRGQALASGIYLYRLEAEGSQLTRKLLLLR
jgi:S-formylglutathione hydrolase FrmB